MNTTRAPGPPEDSVPGLRVAVVSLAVATFAGAGAVVEATAAGMDWPLRIATLLVLSAGIASMVRVGLMRPLAEVAVGELRRRMIAEATLDEIRTRESLLGQIDTMLALATTEADALRVLGRAVCRMAPERDNRLLISSSTGPSLAWEARLTEHGLDDPYPITGPGGCLALSNGRPKDVADSTQFDACPHVAGDDVVMSSVCLPLQGPDGPLGVVWTTGPAGDLPSDIEMGALGRIVTAVGHRLVGIGSDRDLHEGPPEPRDPLTGLPNHVTARATIRTLVQSLTPFCVAICNVDQMGAFNERHGQERGDRALALIAHTLRSTLRPGDVVCRYDGDTFVALFPRCSAIHASAAMERAREALTLQMAEAEVEALTCSTGIADSNQGDSIDDLLEMADVAMLVAKREGGNRVRLSSFDREPDAGAELS